MPNIASTDTVVYQVTIKWKDFCYNKKKRKIVVEAPKEMPIEEVESKAFQSLGVGSVSKVWFSTEELDPVQIAGEDYN